jgi:enoyl-[acyl-carrier-protein] reductase (NADH)
VTRPAEQPGADLGRAASGMTGDTIYADAGLHIVA